MKSNKSKTSAAAITLYVISVLLLAVFAFNIYYSYTNVATYLDSYQMSFGDEWQMFLSSYFQQCIPAFVGAIVSYGIATILVKLENTNQALIACLEEANAPKEESNVTVATEVKKEEKKETKKPVAKKTPKAKEEKVVAETKAEEVKTEEVKADDAKAEEAKTEEK